MLKYGTSDFRVNSNYRFNKTGVESVKFRISRFPDYNGCEIEFDNEFECEDALIDLVEWAYELGREAGSER